jgi:hypothetical protein
MRGEEYSCEDLASSGSGLNTQRLDLEEGMENKPRSVKMALGDEGVYMLGFGLEAAEF